MFWDLILWVAYYKPIKRVGFKNIRKLIYPDYNLKEKHIKNIKKEMEIAKKEFISNLKKYKINNLKIK
jgi:hypothetical protein